VLFIINPTAARGGAGREWAETRAMLSKQGVAFGERLTTRAAEAIEITREALKSGEKIVVAVGGDGTLNEVVNGYFDEAGRAVNGEAAIGLLPCGTGSDFRRSIGLLTREDALNALMVCRTQSFDVIRVELRDGDDAPVTRYSINVVTFGLGGEAVALVNSWRGVRPAWIGGRARFIAAALVALKNYRNRVVRVSFEDESAMSIESNFFVVANGSYAGGGMMLAPHAGLDDGLLDIILTDRAMRWDIVKELPRIQRGEHLKNPKVRELKKRAVCFDSDEPIAVDIDGEPAGFTPARLLAMPSSVRLIVADRQ
jgi:YegS/Rv2252/BmrU family lipid kinase